MTKESIFTRSVTIALAAAVCITSCLLSPVIAGVAESAPINVVYSDDFSADTLGKNWSYIASGEMTDDGNSYTSTVDNGALKVTTHKATRSAFAGCLYLPGMERADQRVAVEFEDLQNGDMAYVYARLSRPDASNWKSLKGYYARYCTTNGKIEIYKINTASNNVALIQCGSRSYTAGEKYRLELTATGAEQTVLTVRMLKISDAGEQVVAQNTYVDTDSPFTSGTAGIAVSGSSASTNDYAYLDNFTYTSTDNVSGNNVYLSHSRTVSSKTFGQVVTLEKGVEYIFAAYGTVDTKDTTGYKNEPLWVEYQTGANQYSTSYTRLVIDRSAIRKTCDLTESECESNNLEYSEYNVSYITFTAGGDDAFADSGLGGLVRHIVGVRLNTSTALVGSYSHFTLYRKDDADRTNLLVNPDFKMGLYGWSDTQGTYHGYTQGAETGAVSSANGYVTLLSDKNNYEYYEYFKNPVYTADEGDANRDSSLDIRDLVFAVLPTTDYYYLIDYNKNGSIDGTDLSELRILLLNNIEIKPEIIGLDNDSVDDDDFS